MTPWKMQIMVSTSEATGVDTKLSLLAGFHCIVHVNTILMNSWLLLLKYLIISTWMIFFIKLLTNKITVGRRWCIIMQVERLTWTMLFSGHTPLYLASFKGHVYVLLYFVLNVFILLWMVWFAGWPWCTS